MFRCPEHKGRACSTTKQCSIDETTCLSCLCYRLFPYTQVHCVVLYAECCAAWHQVNRWDGLEEAVLCWCMDQRFLACSVAMPRNKSRGCCKRALAVQGPPRQRHHRPATIYVIFTAIIVEWLADAASRISTKNACSVNSGQGILRDLDC